LKEQTASFAWSSPICSHCHSHGFFVADPLGAAPASAASVARKATIAPAFTIPET